jgi:hypothetical protein
MKISRFQPSFLVILAMSSFCLFGCFKHVSSDDLRYGEAYRKVTGERKQLAAKFNQDTWEATKQVRAGTPVNAELLKVLRDEISKDNALVTNFAQQKPTPALADFHQISVEFMLATAKINEEQVEQLASGESKGLERMTDKIEKPGLEYEQKLREYFSKADHSYYDQVMKADDEYK